MNSSSSLIAVRAPNSPRFPVVWHFPTRQDEADACTCSRCFRRLLDDPEIRAEVSRKLEQLPVVKKLIDRNFYKCTESEVCLFLFVILRASAPVDVLRVRLSSARSLRPASFSVYQASHACAERPPCTATAVLRSCWLRMYIPFDDICHNDKIFDDKLQR